MNKQGTRSDGESQQAVPSSGRKSSARALSAPSRARKGNKLEPLFTPTNKLVTAAAVESVVRSSGGGSSGEETTRHTASKRSRPTTTNAQLLRTNNSRNHSQVSKSLDSVKKLKPLIPKLSHVKHETSSPRRNKSTGSIFMTRRSIPDSAKVTEDRDRATVQPTARHQSPYVKSSSVDGWKRDKTVNRILNNHCFTHIDSEILPDVPRPSMSARHLRPSLSFSIACLKIQQFIDQLEYNYIDQYFFNTKKNRPLCSILGTAKEIIQECLPIRCIEGTFLAIYFTQNMVDVDRYPVMFASKMQGKIYKHIVLVVHQNGLFGALGMSRKPDLAYKPLTFNSMSDILLDYKQCYANYYHKLKKIRIGLPISHDSLDRTVPNWYFLSLNHVSRTDWSSLQTTIDEYVQESKRAAKDYSKLLKLSCKYRKEGGIQPPSSPSSSASATTCHTENDVK